MIPEEHSEYSDYEDFYCDSAQLYCGVLQGGKQFYLQCGKEISVEQFDKISRETIGKISQVLFQGTETGEHEFGLYKEEFWRDITPVEAGCITYNEAIAWLETQLKNQAE